MKRRLFILFVIIAFTLAFLIYGYQKIQSIDINEAMRVLDEKADSQVIPADVEQEPGLTNSIYITNIGIIDAFDLDDTFYLQGMRIHLSKLQIVDDITLSDNTVWKTNSNGRIILTAQIENLSDKDISFNNIDFSLKTNIGKLKAYSYLKRQVRLFEPHSQGNLKSGEVREGHIYFDYDGTLFDRDSAILTVKHKRELYSFNIGNLSLRFKNQLGEEGTYDEEMDEVE